MASKTQTTRKIRAAKKVRMGTRRKAAVRTNGTTKSYEELFGDNDPRHHILGVYASGLLMLRQFVNDLRKGQAPRYPKIKRLCLQLIDLEPRYHSLLIALIHLEAYKGNLFCRMLNTAVMSIAFGHRIGLNRDQLLDLGMTAFYHDLGWALLGTLNDEATGGRALTMNGINQARNKSDADMEHLRVKVARALVRIGGFNELVINRLIVAYETQIPQESPPEGLYYGEIGANYMTHVIRMASRYDELTTDIEGQAGLHPDQAMRVIMDNTERTYERFLSNLFANSIGAFPVGTLVELDTGEVGLVVNLPVEPVHLIDLKSTVADRSGAAPDDGPIVDLSEKNRSGKFVRSIGQLRWTFFWDQHYHSSSENREFYPTRSSIRTDRAGAQINGAPDSGSTDSRIFE